jgi:hypothetical protein
MPSVGEMSDVSTPSDEIVEIARRNGGRCRLGTEALGQLQAHLRRHGLA